MSHAGRRIASTAAAAAAVALPVAAAGSAYADALPQVGSLPVVGNLVDSATSGGIAQALPVSGLPVVGSLAGTDGSSPLSSLPLVNGLGQGGSPLGALSNVADLTGNGGASPLSGLPAVGGLTNSLTKGGLPAVSNLPLVGGLAGLGAAEQGGSAVAPSAAQSVPMIAAQREAADAVQAAPAAADQVGTDAQHLTTQYMGKHKKA
jgi:hypothetical protein